MRRGVEFVELKSRAGGPCRLRNPWPGEAVWLYRGGTKTAELAGTLLRFETAKGETVVPVPAGRAPARLRRPVPDGRAGG